MHPTARQYRASLFNSYAAHIQKRGLLEQVTSRVSPETAALLRRPPLATQFVSGRQVDELVVAFGQLTSTEELKQLGYESLNGGLIGSVVGPLFRNSIALFGKSPASVFQQLSAFSSFGAKGQQFEYRVTGEHSGELVSRTVDVAPLEGHVLFQGSVRYMFELCGVHGTAQPPRLEDGGRAAVIAVSWTPRG